MRTFLEVLRFELRLQCSGRLFQGVLLLFFVLHALTISEAGINLSDNDLILVNGPSQIFQTLVVLGTFGILPAIVFIVNAIIRDHDRATAEFFLTTPVGKMPWLLGRFAGGTLCAAFAGLAGVLGTMAGAMMPWVDAARIAPFSLLPYGSGFATIVLPNALIVCALCFCAALTRSQNWTFAVAIALILLEVVLVNVNMQGGPPWLALTDPTGALSIANATRYWTVADLNTRLPVTTTLLANRAIWLAISLSLLTFGLVRVRLELPLQARRLRRTDFSGGRLQPDQTALERAGSFTTRDSIAQLASQVRSDVRSVVESPLFVLILVFTVAATISEFSTLRDPILGLPLHPRTGLMLGFFRYGLLQFVLVVLIYYSATLIFREREHGLAEIVGASPHPDWVIVTSKAVTLAAAIALVLSTSMAASIALQLSSGHRELQPGVYLPGLFFFNGFYYWMLCVLAVVVQVLSPGKWSGMVLLTAVLVVLLSLEALGLEHVLYGFSIPFAVYSDFNGFGHFRLPILSLAAYWGLFCVLLMAGAHLMMPRGAGASVPERLREARIRATRGVTLAAGVVTVLFVASGTWIYWNTNILNQYETADSRLHARAEYERRYAVWKNRPTPGFSDISMEVDLYPEERRLESRGHATLVNRRQTPIAEFLVSTDPRLRINRLTMEGATVDGEDAVQGVRIWRLGEALQRGDSVRIEWDATRVHRGFVNSSPDSEIVANGTFVALSDVMPLPAYDEQRELTDPGARRRMGLPEAGRLPALGDPAWLNTLGAGIDGRTDLRVVISTTADQTAIAAGVREREWRQGGRRYAEYVMERPVWPNAALVSARYAVARDTWQDVAIEVYHEPTHPWNVRTMLDTAKIGLDYFSREYAPYPLHSFRILEYPRYRSAARAFPGAVAYAESAGFLTDRRGETVLDYTTIHELAHQWWGGMVYGARMQGRQMLNETMAQYSTLMLFKQQANPEWLRRILAATHRNYLDARSRENVAEQPLMYTEDQGNISYNKGALVMFALQDVIGEARMHQGLRNFLHKFGMQAPPFATSRDLVNELRAVAGPDYQRLITDLFERISLYDVSIANATARPIGDGYELSIDVTARQFEADGQGVEREVPLDAWFDIVVFPDSTSEIARQTPLYLEKQRLQSGTRRQVIRVKEKPGSVGVDPFHLMIDPTPDNNVFRLTPYGSG